MKKEYKQITISIWIGLKAIVKFLDVINILFINSLKIKLENKR